MIVRNFYATAGEWQSVRGGAAACWRRPAAVDCVYLSYTSFEYTDLKIAQPDGPDDSLRVSLTLRNTGARAGAEAVS